MAETLGYISETLKIIYEMIKVVLVSSYFVFLALIWASSWLFIIGSLLQYVENHITRIDR